MSAFVAVVRVLRFLLRAWRRRPRFAVGLLAVGIGATTAMFSIVSAFYLRPLPYPRPDELGVAWQTRRAGEAWSFALPASRDIDARTKTLTGLATLMTTDVTVKLDGAVPEVVMGGMASGNFFDVFAVEAMRGRVFHRDDDRLDAPKVVVLAERFWRRRLGADPNIVGRTLTIDAASYTVVGVAAPGFRYGGGSNGPCDLWMPLAVSLPSYESFLEHRGDHSLQTVTRRKTGVTDAEAQAELQQIMADLGKEFPNTDEGFGVRVEKLDEEMLGSSRSDIERLFAAVGVLLAVVCANVANLLLARSSARRAEMATRLALGATRARIVVQVVSETVLTFVLGAAGGLVIAHILVGPLVQGTAHNYAWANVNVPIDARSYFFALGTALVTGIAAGLAPALEVSRLPPRAVLEAAAGRSTRRRSRLREGLVALQVALAFALLLDSSRVSRDYAELALRDPGFTAEGVAAGLFVLPFPKYDDPAVEDALVRAARAKIGAFPGVESVALVSGFPMSHHDSAGGYAVDGKPRAHTTARMEMLNRKIVTPGYFETLRIRLVRGRTFTDADAAPGSPRVMVLSELAAKLLFPDGEDPIGHRVDWMDHSDDAPEWREVIGVVADLRGRGLDQPPEGMSYVLTSQHRSGALAVVARTSRGDELLAALPKLIADIDPNVGVTMREMLPQAIAESVSATRFTAFFLVAFSLTALLLAALGVFGLVSYNTALRTQEIGLRIAIGATPGDVVRLVMRDGMRLVGLGLAGGFVVHLALRRTFDAGLGAAVLVVLALAGLLATLFPALRAARMNPSTALKSE